MQQSRAASGLLRAPGAQVVTQSVTVVLSVLVRARSPTAQDADWCAGAIHV